MFGHCRAADGFVRIAPPPDEASRHPWSGIGGGTQGMPEAFDFSFLAFVLRDVAIRFGAGIECPNLALAPLWPRGCQPAAQDVEVADHDGGTTGLSPNSMGPCPARWRWCAHGATWWR
ncbi:hypothetical protein IPC744_05540 [Pseudomonas aeruginosa]|nr:hypothetical protein IPC744_05540 [Pseudomonas aeruginosa]RUA99518.1 hypothetical protein IPC1439_18945 [Pseudomonas aeruginosa]RUJ68013.1 hypothetical protein IPC252_03305 [Pseudomonas aeruginosa]TEC57347.1 hypothetical protein IPC1590_04155 [Pseudomonas aeruginosa]